MCDGASILTSHLGIVTRMEAINVANRLCCCSITFFLRLTIVCICRASEHAGNTEDSSNLKKKFSVYVKSVMLISSDPFVSLKKIKIIKFAIHRLKPVRSKMIVEKSLKIVLKNHIC